MDFLHFLNLLFGKILITDMLDIIISQVNLIWLRESERALYCRNLVILEKLPVTLMIS